MTHGAAAVADSFLRHKLDRVFACPALYRSGHSVPLVLLTGQVETDDPQGQIPVRQRRTQEVDPLALLRPITRAQFRPMKPDEVPAAMDRAFAIAAHGRARRACWRSALTPPGRRSRSASTGTPAIRSPASPSTTPTG